MVKSVRLVPTNQLLVVRDTDVWLSDRSLSRLDAGPMPARVENYRMENYRVVWSPLRKPRVLARKRHREVR